MATNRSQFDIQLENSSVPVFITREKRLNARASISLDGIRIRLPNTKTIENCQNYVENLLKWATNIIQRNPSRFQIRPSPSYQHGQLLTIGRNQFLLRIETCQRATNVVKTCGTDTFGNFVIEIILSDSQSEHEQKLVLSRLVSRGCAMVKEPDLRNRIQAINLEFFKFKLGSVRYRFSRNRWGSCSSNGNISISTRLIAAPQSISDYILIHELAHLSEFNHSERFWQIVAKANPNYQEHQAWLLDHQFDPVF